MILSAEAHQGKRLDDLREAFNQAALGAGSALGKAATMAGDAVTGLSYPVGWALGKVTKPLYNKMTWGYVDGEEGYLDKQRDEIAREYANVVHPALEEALQKSQKAVEKSLQFMESMKWKKRWYEKRLGLQNPVSVRSPLSFNSPISVRSPISFK